MQSALLRRQAERRLAETWWGAGGIIGCPDKDSLFTVCQNREGQSRSLYTLPPVGVSLSCMFWVWLFTMEGVLNLTELKIRAVRCGLLGFGQAIGVASGAKPGSAPHMVMESALHTVIWSSFRATQ